MPLNDGGSSQLVYHESIVSPTLRVAERIWSPLKPADAALVIAHGGTWHGGWFGELGDTVCNSASIRVSCADHLSHGLTDDVVHDMRGYVPDFVDIAKELSAAVSRARTAIGENKPIFLLGESMGGLAVLCALTEQLINDDVEGIILCGALIEFAPALKPPRFIVPLLRLVAAIRPTMPIPMPIGGDTFERAFGNSDAAKLAREDTLVCELAPPRVAMFISCFDTLSRVHQMAPMNVRVKSLLFMHYTQDERTSYQVSRNVVESFHHVLDKVVYPVEGTAHQLFQDVPEKAKEHIETVVKFLVDRIQS